MTFTLEEFMQDFTPEELALVAARTAELVEQELTLRDLRHAHRLTQESMAALMGVEQENVSRLERRADLLLSTLSSYVAAMGGKLRLIAEFPNRRPVVIALGDISEGIVPKPSDRSRAAKAGKVLLVERRKSSGKDLKDQLSKQQKPPVKALKNKIANEPKSPAMSGNDLGAKRQKLQAKRSNRPGVK